MLCEFQSPTVNRDSCLPASTAVNVIDTKYVVPGVQQADKCCGRSEAGREAKAMHGIIQGGEAALQAGSIGITTPGVFILLIPHCILITKHQFHIHNKCSTDIVHIPLYIYCQKFNGNQVKIKF